jgi:hypothetical protein
VEYDAIASKERLTGRAYFNPGIAGGTGITSMPWLDLGNIQLMSLDYGIKRKEHYKARRGMLITDRYDAYSATPRWEITGDEFTSSTLFLIFLGTDAGDVTQIHAENQTINFNVHVGGVLDVAVAGTTKFCLYNWSIPGATSGVDYIVDPGPGKLYIPWTTTFAENAAKVLTVSWPAVTFDKILPPLSNLNRSGMMQIIEEDDSGPTSVGAFASPYPAPKTVHDFAVSLSTDSGGQTKVDDYKAFKMIATVTDPSSWTIRKRNT